MKQDFLGIYTGLLAALLAFPLQAAVYQWTDENGRVHFSDRPTHESAQQRAMPKTSPSSSGESMPQDRQQRRQRMLEVYEQERAEKRDAAAQAKEERKERQRRCMTARVDYENYRNTNTIYELQEDGSRKYLSEQQREEYLSKLKAKMDKYCK